VLTYRKTGKDADRQLLKRLRGSGSFRDCTVKAGDIEIRIAVVDGLTGLEKLKSSVSSGAKYHLVEVMTCPGGCIHGGGLPQVASREDLKNRARLIYQADETEAISLPEKSPSVINLYEKLIKNNKEISDKKIFHTHFEKKSVLL
jgi:iron only hydrogenase large subunit-like protein